MAAKGTKQRFIRIPDSLWDKAMARAASEDVTLSELIRTWLDLYANDDQVMSVSAELARIVGRLNDVCKRITKVDDVIAIARNGHE